jgi:uncharacterized protein YdeI (YjbR/CyaY-like superfamily)
MALKNKDKRVDQYIDEKAEAWQQPYAKKLRELMIECPVELKETIKWGAPAYVGKKNVAGIVALKNHISLWLYEGALLDDPDNILIQASDSTKSLRQVRFIDGAPLPDEKVAKLIKEAAKNDQKGLKVEQPKPKKPKSIPSPLREMLDENPKAKETYENLPPSEQKAYIEHIRDAKRDSTKERRAKKSISLLNQGKGLNDKYKN